MRFFGITLLVSFTLVAMPSAQHIAAQPKTPAKTETKTAPPKTKSAPSFPKVGAQPKTKQPAPKKKGPDKPPVKKPAKPKPPISPEVKKQLAEWDKLNQRRREIGRDLKFLRTQFSISSRADKLKIKEQYDGLTKEWSDKVSPKMQGLAIVKLGADPDSKIAAELLADHPRQGEVVAGLEKLLKSGEDSGVLLKSAAIANFNMNNFERAFELIDKARDKNALGFEEFSLPEEYGKYVKNWKAEKALRTKQEAAKGEEVLPTVEIETSRGKIKVVLYENEAPNTVANFIDLIEKKFYDEQHVHRVEPNFVVQMGDPNTKPTFDPKKSYGIGGPGYNIKCECFEENARLHYRGSLSMAHAGRDTGGSQFFIAFKPTPFLNPDPSGRRGHTVFGHVTSGMDVVEKIQRGDKIIKVTVLNKRNHEYKPRKVGDPVPDPKEKTEPKPKKKESGAPKFPKTKSKESGKPKPKTGSKTTPAKTTPAKTSAAKTGKTPAKTN